MRREVIMVVGDIADEVDGPALVGPIAQIGLIVEERRIVLCIDVALRGEQEASCLVAHAVEPREILRADAQIGAGSQQTRRERAFGNRLPLSLRLQPLVADVECRRHLVAVFRRKATRREANALHHIGIDHRESFLLTATNEERAEHLDVVDIDAVLVERTASNVVLRRQLVVCRHACLTLNHLLDGIARRRRCVLHILLAQLLRLGGLALHLSHVHLAQRLVFLLQDDLQRLLALRIAQHTGASLITDHREANFHRVGRLQFHRELALERRERSLTLLHHLYGSQLDRA